MDRYGAERARQVERDQSDLARGGHLEAMGAIRTRRVPARPAAAIRLGGEEGRTRRDQGLPAYADYQQHGVVLGACGRRTARASLLKRAAEQEELGISARHQPAARSARFRAAVGHALRRWHRLL